jgi:predicted enzyme related to lactoylglutathione lyase
MTPEIRPANVVWFELPVRDMERATTFYETIFGIRMITNELFQMIKVFPYDRPIVSGCLIANDQQPTTEGTVVYLNCNGQLDSVLARATEQGAEIVEPKTLLPGNIGWTAQIRDSEGNRVGLHATL